MNNIIYNTCNNDVMQKPVKQQVKLTEKYFLTIREAAKVFGIGDETLRRFVKEHEGAEYLAYVGNRTLIKRKKFEEYLDNNIIAF